MLSGKKVRTRSVPSQPQSIAFTALATDVGHRFDTTEQLFQQYAQHQAEQNARFRDYAKHQGGAE